MSLSPGSRFGSYEIIAPLGAGGMGEVYRARDTRLKRDVAVKVLPADVVGNPERLGRFEREAHLLASLNHPNIASIYGLEEAGATPALVMELVEGESLAERITRGPVPVSDAVDIARQVAEALEYAHERGIIHRDLKPANIVVAHEGAVKVLDFGLAKAITGDSGEGTVSDATHSPTLTSPATRAGVILGTAAYMAPEQARGKLVDRRADIWAFGVVVFEMLTGRRMFEGETVSDTIAAILTRSPDYSALPQNTPVSVRRLLERCLERDPKMRLRDIGEARIVLADPGMAEPVLAPAGARGASGRHPVLPWVVAAIAVAAAVVFAWRSMQPVEVASSPIRYAQRTFRPQMIFQALYAPDGESIVYSAAPNGSTPYLYSLRPEYTEPLKMSEDPLHLLSISSSGELAVLTHPRWFGHRLCSGTLARMPLSGGAPRELLEDVIQATWDPRGGDLAITRHTEGVFRLEYPAGKTLVQTAGYVSDLRFSPDGKYIAYFEHPARWDDRGGIAIVDLEGNRRLLSDGYWGEEGIAWASDSRTVYFSAGTGYSDFTIYAAPLEGPAHVVMQSAGGLVIHDVSRDGQWLATRDDLNRVMMVRPAGASRDVDMSWLELPEPVELSADGRVLLFTEAGTSAGSNYQVCLRRTDGSPVVVLGEGYGTDLSDDGRWALAGIYPNRVLAYPTGAGKSIEFNMGSLETVVDARWLSSGKEILAVGGKSGEASSCYIVDMKGGAPRNIGYEGANAAYPAPDGRHMLLLDADLLWWVVTLDSSAAAVRAPLTRRDRYRGWSTNSTGVYVAHRPALPDTIEFVDLATGKRRATHAVFDPRMAGVIDIQASAISPNEKVYAYAAQVNISRLYTVQGAR